MKRTVAAVLLAAPALLSAEHLVPAGSIVQCTVSEPRLSSKTAAIGDPILCRINRIEPVGRNSVPYGSFLAGHFEEYKDPGHFVGKGWMELKFDRVILQPDTSISVATKVVDVPKYPVDREGRIHGTGHPVRDIVEWSIPILWPIDLLNLPRRGPRPTLKAETRLTLKVMDDFGIPDREDTVHPPALVSRAEPAPVVYAPPPPHEVIIQMPQQAPAPVVYNYAPPPPAPVVYNYPPPPPPPYRYAPAPAYRVYYYGR